MAKKCSIVPGLTLPASISWRASFDALLNLEGFPMCEVIFCIASSICVSEASTVVLNRRRFSGTARKYEKEFAYLFLMTRNSWEDSIQKRKTITGIIILEQMRCHYFFSWNKAATGTLQCKYVQYQVELRSPPYGECNATLIGTFLQITEQNLSEQSLVLVITEFTTSA